MKKQYSIDPVKKPDGFVVCCNGVPVQIDAGTNNWFVNRYEAIRFLDKYIMDEVLWDEYLALCDNYLGMKESERFINTVH